MQNYADFVCKDMAVHLAMQGYQQQTWTQHFLNPENKYELLGLISSIGVPASYLRAPDYCKSTPAGIHTPLANINYEQVRLENSVLPWDFILTTTLGARPAYWKQCISTSSPPREGPEEVR